MQFSVRHGSLTETECDVLIINLFQGVKEPAGGTGAVNKALGGLIAEVIREDGFEGNLGETLVVRPCGGIPAKKVVVVGLGKQEDFGATEIMIASGSAARKCRELKAGKVAGILHGAGVAGLPTFDCAKALVVGAMLGTYEYNRLKTENVRENPIESFEIVELSSEKIGDIEGGMKVAEIIGDALIFARDLSNEPSNVVTPSYLAERAQEIAEEFGMACRVKDRKAIEEAGMGLLAAVARGSVVEPRFIEIRYDSPDAQKTVAVVGKGITFDTGGYSLKSSESMYGMKDDMSGAGDVLAVMRAVGKLKPKVNVVALIPATENSIDSNAIHPGDVFKSYSGKSVEVVNTDAEGRLILADAIAYAVKLGVDEIVDLATLTGACVIALGHELSGIFGSKQDLVERLVKAGGSCGEKLWQLPLHMAYKDSLKSDVADLKNTGARHGGAIVAALFLHSFTGGVAWAHIDLSSVVSDRDTPLAKKGATGVGTGTLIHYLMSFAAQG